MFDKDYVLSLQEMEYEGTEEFEAQKSSSTPFIASAILDCNWSTFSVRC